MNKIKFGYSPFCNSTEYTEEVNTMKAQSKISNVKMSSDEIDLEQPTIFRRKN